MADLKTFDPYEYVAVIAPGTVVAVGLLAQWPDEKSCLLNKDFSLGEFGIFLVCAFVLGHIVQALGNGLEALVFFRSGKPTDWMRKPNCDLISPTQRLRLVEKLKAQQGDNFSLETVSEKAWYSVTREVYAAVSEADRAQRIDSFNRTYGLMRGIAAALCAVTIWLLIVRWGQWAWSATAAVLAGLAIYRMVHFGKLYARELFVQFLGC